MDKNGFKILSKVLRQAINNGKITEQEAAAKLKVYDFLSECGTAETYALIDSSALNEIIMKFCKTAIYNAQCSRMQEENILNELQNIFDTCTAAEIMKKEI